MHGWVVGLLERAVADGEARIDDCVFTADALLAPPLGSARVRDLELERRALLARPREVVVGKALSKCSVVRQIDCAELDQVNSHPDLR